VEDVPVVIDAVNMRHAMDKDIHYSFK
jgi:hypothetical protein